MSADAAAYRFCSLERARLVHSILLAPFEHNGANLHEYIQSGKIRDIFPMHDPKVLPHIPSQNVTFINFVCV